MIRLLRERGYEKYLVLWHYLDNTRVQLSTFADLPADAWGNLFFFHSSLDPLFEQVCADPDWTAVLDMAGEFEELTNLLRAKETAITELSQAADERLGQITELTRAADERLGQITELSRAADERLQSFLEVSDAAHQLQEELALVRGEFETFKRCPPLRDVMYSWARRAVRLAVSPFQETKAGGE
jgi:hypothetical protein